MPIGSGSWGGVCDATRGRMRRISTRWGRRPAVQEDASRDWSHRQPIYNIMICINRMGAIEDDISQCVFLSYFARRDKPASNQPKQPFFLCSLCQGVSPSNAIISESLSLLFDAIPCPSLCRLAFSFWPWDLCDSGSEEWQGAVQRAALCCRGDQQTTTAASV